MNLYAFLQASFGIFKIWAEFWTTKFSWKLQSKLWFCRWKNYNNKVSSFREFSANKIGIARTHIHLLMLYCNASTFGITVFSLFLRINFKKKIFFALILLKMFIFLFMQKKTVWQTFTLFRFCVFCIFFCLPFIFYPFRLKFTGKCTKIFIHLCRSPYFNDAFVYISMLKDFDWSKFLCKYS